MVLTAGPTHEAIDSVRFIGNRSSGRMGLALTRAALDSGWRVILLLGPVADSEPHQSLGSHLDSKLEVHRFRSCADLGILLDRFAPQADCIVMAAAVADYRPRPNPALSGGKFRRTQSSIALELEPTPDLIARIGAERVPGRFLVGFALEPLAELEQSAREKLERKNLDIVVANPLETMDSDSVRALIVRKDSPPLPTPGTMLKRDFAPWLMNIINHAYDAMNQRP